LRIRTVTRKPVAVEVCVESVASAVAAARGGAARVELCSDLLEGGLTPSAGQIEVVRQNISVGLHVMIRPHGGDFLYSPEELEIMQRDIQVAKNLGADGVVFGILEPGGNVDLKNTRRLVDCARPLSVTFHRAFDMSADLFRALEDIVICGADRVLTSGAQSTAALGRRVIAELIRVAEGRVVVVPAGGIAGSEVRHLLERTGASEIHVGLGNMVPSPMQYRNERVSIGSAAGREYQRFVVLEDSVRNLVAAFNG
jgi:copper homeostasis protein